MSMTLVTHTPLPHCSSHTAHTPVATYPLDLVRARLSIATANMAQTGGGPAAFTAEDARLGIVGMTKKVYATEGGLRGLYRGCWATAVGVAPYGESQSTGTEAWHTTQRCRAS